MMVLVYSMRLSVWESCIERVVALVWFLLIHLCLKETRALVYNCEGKGVA